MPLRNCFVEILSLLDSKSLKHGHTGIVVVRRVFSLPLSTEKNVLDLPVVCNLSMMAVTKLIVRPV